MSTWRAVLPSLALATLLVAPFAGKAFTIDDTLFLDQALQARRDPLHPTAIDVVWRADTARLSRIMPSGPTMAWLLAPVATRGEVAVHAVGLLALLLALVATARLALRLGGDAREAAWAALFVAASPAVAAMASAAMPDAAAMALGVGGVERALAWRDERRWHQAILAALLLALAAAARLHLLLVVGVAALLVDGELVAALRARSTAALRSRLFAAPLWPILAAPLGLAALLLATRDPGGGGTLGAAGGFLSWRSLDRNLPAFGLHWLLAMTFGVPSLVLVWRRLRWRLGLLLAALFAALFVSAESARSIWLAPVAAVGWLLIFDAIEDAARRRDAVELGLSLWLLVALPVAGYLNLAAKYVIASAPAAAILLARRLRGHRRLALATVVVGSALGAALLAADAHLAAVGRRAAAELIAPRTARGERVWFLGHWGFQWYAERAGARPLTHADTPAGGDTVVYCEVTGVNVEDLPSRWTRGPLLGSVADEAPGGRLMSRRDDAGFYSTSWGFLPWSWGGGADDPADRCRAYGVARTSTSGTSEAR